jgi:hypothetical protein
MAKLARQIFGCLHVACAGTPGECQKVREVLGIPSSGFHVFAPKSFCLLILAASLIDTSKTTEE